MSRSDGRSRALRTRPSRTVPAVLAALALIALGVVLAWPPIQSALTGSIPPWASSLGGWLEQRSWADPWTVAAIAVVGLLGLALVIAGVAPGRAGTYQIVLPERTTPGPVLGSDVVVSRRGMARLATAQAHRVSGVESVSATVDGSRIRLHVTTYVQPETAVAEQVGQLVRDSLTAANVQPVPRVSVSTARPAGVA